MARQNETHLIQDGADWAFKSRQVVRLALVNGRGSRASGKREAKRGRKLTREHALERKWRPCNQAIQLGEFSFNPLLELCVCTLLPSPCATNEREGP